MKVRAFKATETVSTGDGDFTLAIDMEVIDALEDEFDCGFDELMQQFQGKVRIGKLARLLRGLLVKHHPGLSLDEAGALAYAYGAELGEGMGRLFEKAQPPAEEAKGTNPPKARGGARKSSTARGVVPA